MVWPNSSKGLKLTLAPYATPCPGKQLAESQANLNSCYEFPNSPWDQKSHLLLRAFPLCASKMRPQWSLLKPCSFLFDLTNCALAWELQSAPPTDPNEGPQVLSLSLPALWLHLPEGSLEVFHVLPPRPVTNKLLHLNPSCGLLLNHSSPSGTLCST